MALTDQCMKMLQESPSQSRHEGPKLGHPGNSLFPPLKGSHLVSGSKELVCFPSQRNSTQNFWVSGPVDLHGRVSDEIMSQIQMQMLQPQTLDPPRQGLSTEIGSVGGPRKAELSKKRSRSLLFCRSGSWLANRGLWGSWETTAQNERTTSACRWGQALQGMSFNTAVDSTYQISMALHCWKLERRNCRQHAANDPSGHNTFVWDLLAARHPDQARAKAGNQKVWVVHSPGRHLLAPLHPWNACWNVRNCFGQWFSDQI